MRIVLVILLATMPLAAQSQFPADADVRVIARKGVAIAGNAGVVIGLIEPDRTTRVVNATDVLYDGRTLFEIGSITKVFTGILLAEMVERGEVRLEEPVQDLLPKGVTVPSRNGKQIRLVDLATHSSGLPRMPGNFAPADPRNPYADYTPERLYQFLRGHQLTRDIGERTEYSNLGGGLLGHALALRAGKSYEALVTERILTPLAMTSTRVLLLSADRARLAPGHSAAGNEVPNWDIGALAGAGGLRSSVDDMLKFMAANLDPPARISTRRTVRWVVLFVHRRPRAAPSATRGVVLADSEHAFLAAPLSGTTAGQPATARIWGSIPSRRSGVVVLSNRSNGVDAIGMHLLDPRHPVSIAGIATGFHVLPLSLATLLIVGAFVSSRRTGATRRHATFAASATAVGLLVWLGGTYWAALLGLLRFDTRPPTMMVVVWLMVALAIGVGVSPMGRRLAAGLPLWILVGVQAFRLPLELLLHESYEAGLMPVQMSFNGFNFDIVTGPLRMFKSEPANT